MPNEIKTLWPTVRIEGTPNPSRSLNFWVLAFELVFVFLASSAVSHAEHTCIEATGTVVVSRVTTHGVQIPLDSYTASVFVALADDGRFKIQLFNHPLYTKRQIIFSFDGTNNFYLISKSDTNIPNTNTWISSTITECYLSAEEIPLIIFDDAARDALWYALCSGNFLKKHGQSGEILQLFASPRRSVMGYGYRYEATLTNSIFCLPYELDIWRDKKLDKKDREAEESRIELDAKGQGTSLYDSQWAGKSFIPDGSHALKLVWKRDFLLQNQRLPLEIELTTFYPAQTNPPPLFNIRLEFEPWHLSTDNNQTFRPPDPTEQTRVRDARTRIREGSHYVDNVVYMLGTSSSNSTWLTMSDPRLKQGIAAALDAQMTMTPGPKRRLVALLFLITLVSPVLFFLYHIYKKGKHNLRAQKVIIR